MDFFTKEELKVVISVLVILILLFFVNLKASLRKTRDAQRKDDLWSISNGLNRYSEYFGQYPASSADGRIIACINNNNLNELVSCEWGKHGLEDVYEQAEPPFLAMLPIDPLNQIGVSYYYASSGEYFQILGHLEGRNKEDEFMQEVEDRNVMCGVKVCNFGRSSKDTPLDKSVEEYEQELEELLKGVDKQ
jgi:type II secretory pathway pseudopilin PulG